MWLRRFITITPLSSKCRYICHNFVKKNNLTFPWPTVEFVSTHDVFKQAVLTEETASDFIDKICISITKWRRIVMHKTEGVNKAGDSDTVVKVFI